MSEDDRRAYRAWLRAHHPDLGGDRDAFEAGLRFWRARLGHPGGTRAAPVTAYRRPRGPVAWLVRRVARRRARRERRLRLR